MKLQEFQDYLKTSDIGAAFFFQSDSSADSTITYFTGMAPSQAILVIQPEKADLYLSKLDLPPKMKGIAIRPLPKDWAAHFSSMTQGKTMGINKERLPVQHYEKLLAVSKEIVDVGEKMRQLRMTKTKSEIKHVAQACKITSEAFTALLEELPKRTLKTEQDVALFLERFIKNKGAQLAFPTIVGTGKNSSVPHHVTSNSPLRKGFLQLDFGARWNHYCADMSRVLYLGKPTRKEVDIYNLLLHVQEAVIQEIKENKPYAELDRFTRKKLGKHQRFFVHGLGHGVGIDIHELPVYSDAVVQKGHIFTIEPGIYYPNKFGLRIEDTLVFEGTVKRLTLARKDLLAVEFYTKILN